MLATWMLRSEKSGQIVNGKLRIGRYQGFHLKTGSGPDLVLLHGLLGTARAWMPSLSRLGQTSTVHALDALGLGESDRVPGLDASLGATADRVILALDSAGIQRADILGTSHGGSVAMVLAARYPERVRSLILHAPANPFSDVADPIVQFYRTSLGRWFAHRIASLPRRLQNLALGRMYGDAAEPGEGSIDYYTRSLRVPGTVDHVLRILENWKGDMFFLRGLLDRLTDVPTLLLWGRQDRAVSLESAEELQKYLRRSQIVYLPRTGHLPYEEVPELFSEAVNGFLRRQPARDTERKMSPLVRQTSAA